MAKKSIKESKAQTANKLKNVLSVALGMVFRKWRDKEGLTSDEIAEELGIGGSFYRLIEAGTANMSVARINTLYRVFSFGGKNKLQFDALCKILVAISVLDTGTDSVEEMHALAMSLADTDEKLAELFAMIDKVWEVMQEGDNQKITEYLNEKDFSNSLETFLQNYVTFSIAKDKRLDFELNELIKETPTLNLYMVMDMLKTFQNHPPLHTYRFASKWETENNLNFTKLYGVYEDYKSIVNETNLALFNYNYLFQKNFQSMHFVFLNKDIAQEKIKKEFSDNLRLVLAKQPNEFQKELDAFDEVLKNKVIIKTANHLHDKFKQLCEHSFDKENPNIRFKSNFWCFTLKDGNNVGFISKNNDLVVGLSLSYGDTITKLEAFKTLWNEL